MLIFALFCCGQFSLLLWSRFLEIPIRMTIKNGQALTEKLPLPSITFCSEKPVDKWYEEFLGEVNIPPKFTKEEVLDAMRLGVGELTPLYVEHQQPLNVTLMDILDNVLAYNHVTTRDFVSRVSVPCEVLLSRCELRGKIVPCSDLFERVNGQCCRFYDDPETFVSSGDLFSNNLKVQTTMDYGDIYVMIHRPLSEPLIEQSSFMMANGYYVMFYIQPLSIEKSEEVHEMEEEAGVCVHPDEQDLRFFDSYDYFNCAMEWIINASMAVCGCAATYTRAPDEYTCNFTGMNCLRKYSTLNKMVYGLPIHERLSHLAASKGIEMQTCPEVCTYTHYSWNFKPRVLVPDHDCTGFLSGVDPNNSFVAHFTYENQFYKIQEFVLITDWITLISNLGGVYGIFLGCSMLTLVELVFYLWTRVVRKMCTNRVQTTEEQLMDKTEQHRKTLRENTEQHRNPLGERIEHHHKTLKEMIEQYRKAFGERVEQYRITVPKTKRHNKILVEETRQKEMPEPLQFNN
ncbi:sodium channel protein Nach-like [Leguminivora glycinivorella]|uniref:sodium channel protein Nach-like n=1 Tax=Leguminivora glycinivorella TaxID=1035111 RepID=UPI00200D4256|nr:sodium channel protein Nach-like [Leguminivora glycinivorella]